VSNESETLKDKGLRMDKQLLLKKKFWEINPSRKENSVVAPDGLERRNPSRTGIQKRNVPPVSER
jgi:hypothetical protein